MDFEELKREAEKKLSEINNPQDLRIFSIEYLGKKGKIREMFLGLKDVSAEQRKELGAQINAFAAAAEAKVKELEARFAASASGAQKKELEKEREELGKLIGFGSLQLFRHPQPSD